MTGDLERRFREAAEGAGAEDVEAKTFSRLSEGRRRGEDDGENGGERG
jgi:hypothetical protein